MPLDAAWELRYAATLLPKSAAPRSNLALLYEWAGRLERAEAEWRTALALEPEDLEIVGHLADTERVSARSNFPARRLGDVVTEYGGIARS